MVGYLSRPKLESAVYLGSSDVSGGGLPPTSCCHLRRARGIR